MQNKYFLLPTASLDFTMKLFIFTFLRSIYDVFFWGDNITSNSTSTPVVTEHSKLSFRTLFSFMQ